MPWTPTDFRYDNHAQRDIDEAGNMATVDSTLARASLLVTSGAYQEAHMQHPPDPPAGGDPPCWAHLFDDDSGPDENQARTDDVCGTADRMATEEVRTATRVGTTRVVEHPDSTSNPGVA